MKGDIYLTPMELEVIKAKLTWIGWKNHNSDVWFHPATNLGFSIYTAARIAGVYPRCYGDKNESLPEPNDVVEKTEPS